MIELTTALKQVADQIDHTTTWTAGATVCRDAAAEIARLRGEIEKTRAELWEWIWDRMCCSTETGKRQKAHYDAETKRMLEGT